MAINSIEFDFGSSLIQEAIAEIKSTGLHKLYCSLTGAEYATISDSEIEISLRMEIQRKPMIEMAALVSAFGLRHSILSSGPCPSLRVHKDHSTLLRLLKSSSQGPDRLLCYLAGRLFFDSMVSEREFNSLSNRVARLAFLRRLQHRSANLPSNWSQSLQPQDELDHAAARAINVLHVVGGKTTNADSIQIDEGKAAQSSLEILLRLDAIHNLRHAFYSNSLKDRLIEFRSNLEPTFTQLASLLNELEQDGIVRLMRQRTPKIGNAMAITAALESLNWTRRRHGKAQDTYLDSIEKGFDAGKFGTGTISSAQILQIKEIVSKPSLSKKDKTDLESVLKELEKEATAISLNDKRLDALRTQYKHSSVTREKRGKLKVSDSSALKHLVESYLDKGVAIPKELEVRIKSLKKSGKQVKPETLDQLNKRMAEKPTREIERAIKKAKRSSLGNKLFKSTQSEGIDLSAFATKKGSK